MTEEKTEEVTEEIKEEPLYLAIIWHQHQPLYYKDIETKVYSKPWVRMHAVKDYYDMVAILEEYPKIHATFNLTPTLIRQLDDLIKGAKDRYLVLAEKRAEDLTKDEKEYILKRFFDANWDKVIGRFPRYKELLIKRGKDESPKTIEKALKSFTTQDFRDLQVWFNLAWVDPDFLAQEPLKNLVEKGTGFSEEDKKVLFHEHKKIIEMVLPKHDELQKKGNIEITMCPFSHPILPLLYDTNLAERAMPDAKLPENRFSYPLDVISQLNLGKQLYIEHFGIEPRGMWPAEGSVAQEIVKMVADIGIKWMASDEEVLAKSLRMDGFTRDSNEVVQESNILYRPYTVSYKEYETAIIFRDHLISDKVGFTYSGMPGKVAAKDFVQRIHDIKNQLEKEGAEGPNLVTVLLDGENAWEYYENDGKEFLHTMYKLLSQDEEIKCVTPSEYLKIHPVKERIKYLWPGSWISHDFSTWIGEDEENRAWDYLRRVREYLTLYEKGEKKIDEKTLKDALTMIYFAEGSDWFWWYGSDQSVPDEEAFDIMFRNTLMAIYKILGEEPPSFLSIPIMARRSPPPDRGITDIFTPKIDGTVSGEEWKLAGAYNLPESIDRDKAIIESIYFGYDEENIYLRLDTTKPWNEIAPEINTALYISTPKSETPNGFARYRKDGEETILGYGAGYEVNVSISEKKATVKLYKAMGDETWSDEVAIDDVKVNSKILEIAIPFENLGELSTGDNINIYAIIAKEENNIAEVPWGGPAKIVVPELGKLEVVMEIDDAEGDDYGHGNVTYPLDSVFSPKCFDIDKFIVGTDDENIVFKFKMYGPIENVWNSPINLSVQEADIYIDIDRIEGSGGKMLLPGRNTGVNPKYAWDYVVWVEGWMQHFYKVDLEGKPVEVDTNIIVNVDPVAKTITIRIPKSVLAENPEDWAYIAVINGQEGFPSVGNWRVRDVNKESAQWRFGGGDDGLSDPNVIDIALPKDYSPSQEDMLSGWNPSTATSLDDVDINDFCEVSGVTIEDILD